MKIVFKVYINISMPFIMEKKPPPFSFFFFFFFTLKGKWKIFLSLYRQFNLEVPLLENYIGQLRGARGNSWE